MNESIHVTKLDAALRQLNTAIILYFNSADIVSIHTLVAAAYNILRDLRKDRGADFTMFKDAKQIADGYKEEFRKLLNEAENFFKHADKDPKESLVYYPLTAELLLIDACDAYIRLTGEEPGMVAVFKRWHAILHPNYYDTGAPALAQVARMAQRHYKETDRLEFLQNCLVCMARLKTEDITRQG